MLLATSSPLVRLFFRDMLWLLIDFMRIGSTMTVRGKIDIKIVDCGNYIEEDEKRNVFAI